MLSIKFIIREIRFYANRAHDLKEAASGTIKEMGKDAQNAAQAAKETLTDDFRAVADSIAKSSDKIDEKFRGTDKERFHAAEDAAKRAEQEDRKFVFSEHAENPFNKASKTMNEAKEYAKDNLENAKQSLKENVKDNKEYLKESANHVKEKVMPKSPEQKSFDAAKRAHEAPGGYSEKPNLTEKIENIAEKIGEKSKFNQKNQIEIKSFIIIILISKRRCRVRERIFKRDQIDGLKRRFKVFKHQPDGIKTQS